MTAQTLNRFEWLKAVNRSDLLPRAKVAASALAIEFCNDRTGRLNPGVNTLADATGQTVDTVKRAIRDLTDSGWLGRTEGRGRGNKTEYTLLSPGKVIAMASTKKGAHMHQAKGGTHAPSHYKDQQTTEQRARTCPVRALRIVHADDAEKVASWNAWLSDNGFPSLQEIPALKSGDERGPGYLMPRLWVPSCDEDQDMVRKYLLWAVDCNEVRYAAQ